MRRRGAELGLNGRNGGVSICRWRIKRRRTGHDGWNLINHASGLFVLNAPERQVDARLGDAPFFRHFMLEVHLRVTGHDQQATVGQPFRK